MSLLTLRKEQQNKPFKKADLIIYFVLAVVIITLFLVIFADKNNGENVGFEVILEETIILTYHFKGEKCQVATGYEDYFLIEKSSDGLFVTIFIDKKKSEFNKLLIDNNKKHVYMLDANCSSAKDCTKMAIKSNNDVIVCVPHKLKIKGLSDEIQQPISG